jgi:hypothetical protein
MPPLAGKEQAMSDNRNENRVLNRRGARQLSNDELDKIAGGGSNTRASRLPTGSVTNPDFDLDT